MDRPVGHLFPRGRGGEPLPEPIPEAARTQRSVRIERSIYQGGHFRLELACIADASVRLHMSAPEPFAPPPDGVLSIVARDGWVIPS